MRRSQSNYFNMAKSVCDVFGNSQVWRGNALIEESVAKITDLCAKINREATKQQQNDTKGYTASKEQERTLLEDRTFRLGGRLKVYAQKTGDKVVAAQVTFTRSTLDILSMNNLLTTARSVLETATGLLPTLAPYQVTQADVDELQQSVTVTEGLNAHRDAVRGERTENTTHLALLFSELRNELKLMDTQVEAYIDDEEFLRTYFITRRIHDIRGGSAKKPAEVTEPA